MKHSQVTPTTRILFVKSRILKQFGLTIYEMSFSKSPETSSLAYGSAKHPSGAKINAIAHEDVDDISDKYIVARKRSGFYTMLI